MDIWTQHIYLPAKVCYTQVYTMYDVAFEFYDRYTNLKGYYVT